MKLFKTDKCLCYYVLLFLGYDSKYYRAIEDAAMDYINEYTYDYPYAVKIYNFLHLCVDNNLKFRNDEYCFEKYEMSYKEYISFLNEIFEFIKKFDDIKEKDNYVVKKLKKSFSENLVDYLDIFRSDIHERGLKKKNSGIYY